MLAVRLFFVDEVVCAELAEAVEIANIALAWLGVGLAVQAQPLSASLSVGLWAGVLLHD